MAPFWKDRRYKLAEPGNFDEFLQALGVNFVLRKVATAVSPTVKMEFDGEHYNIRQESTFRTIEIKFKPDEEFIEETPDGRKTRTIITFENENKLIQKQMDGIPVEVIREFTETELKTTLKCKNVVCVRVYRAES